MAKCPKCGEEIDKLVTWVRKWTECWFDGEEYTERQDSDALPHIDVSEFCCPECYEVLFYTEDAARRFLKSST